jgi:hypothetical protein
MTSHELPGLDYELVKRRVGANWKLTDEILKSCGAGIGSIFWKAGKRTPAD